MRPVRVAVTALLTIIHRVFFRRVEAVGLDRVPASGAVLFVLNHPNGLLDPLFILVMAPRPVSFLAKEPILRMPLVGFLARAIDCLPVYRKQDEADPKKNRATFERARALLSSGGAIAIFPEGTTHSGPELLPMKTGAARIALGACGAGEELDLQIVPAGLYYTAKQTFRSDALVRFGEPFPVPRVALDEAGNPPADAVRELSDRIDARLREVTVNASEAEALDLVERAERIFRSGSKTEIPDSSRLAVEMELRRRFVAAYAHHRERSPARVAALVDEIDRFEAVLQEAGVGPESLSPRRFRPWPAARFAAIHVLRALVLLPAAIVGTIVHYPSYRLVGVIADRVAKGDQADLASIKVVASLLLFPLTWLAAAIACGCLWGLRYGLAAIALGPLTALAAVLFWEVVHALAGGARALGFFLGRPRFVEQMVARRDAIRAEIKALGEDAESAK